jgi:hypothetical protein
MIVKERLGLAALILLLVPVSALAQDAGKVGVTMGYPPAVGIIWQVTDRFALRPDFGITRSWSGSSVDQDAENTSLGLTIGISALFYVTKADNLRTYFSPRYAYLRTSSSSTADFLPFDTSFKTTGSNLSGSFGAEYALGSRFSAFGEVGVAYSHQSLRSGFVGERPSSNSISLRSGAGVILYF